MCGIVGIVRTDGPGAVPEDLVVGMMSTMRHRGPDESGMYCDARIVMGHLRLSIIGLDDGTQPIGNEDGTLWVVFNGEIYNYIELKKELMERGHRFSSGTDTEVILHLYEDMGAECFGKLNGPFAVAIWDSRHGELILARDRLGVRPLFYTRVGTDFMFASEIKALLANPEVTREIDPESLMQVFTFWSTLNTRTVFKGIHQLAPGTWMTIKDRKSLSQRYWSLPCPQRDGGWRGSFDEAAERLAELLEDSIRLRLRSDVPVGAYLSGGLDSSIITALISRNFNNSLRTFSVGFAEQQFDETWYQQEMVRFTGANHSSLLIKNQVLLEHLPEVVWHCETPITRTAPIPLYLLSSLVRDNGFKVVVTGEGADEIFGGYNIFKEAKVREFWSRAPGSTMRPLLLERLYPYVFKNPGRLRPFLQGFFAPGEIGAADPFFSHRIRWDNSRKNVGFFSAEMQAAIAGYEPGREVAASLPDRFDATDVVSRAQLLEMDIFLANYLLSSQGDRVAMAHSVEQRHPFLDYRLVEFAFSLPHHWKLKALNEKHILKRAAAGVIPESIRQRKKQPYRAPIREIFVDPADGIVRELLSEAGLKSAGLFDPVKTGLLFEKFRDHRAVPNEFQSMAMIAIASAQILHHRFIAERISTSCFRPDRIVRAARDHNFNQATERKIREPFRTVIPAPPY